MNSLSNKCWFSCFTDTILCVSLFTLYPVLFFFFFFFFPLPPPISHFFLVSFFHPYFPPYFLDRVLMGSLWKLSCLGQMWVTRCIFLSQYYLKSFHFLFIIFLICFFFFFFFFFSFFSFFLLLFFCIYHIRIIPVISLLSVLSLAIRDCLTRNWLRYWNVSEQTDFSYTLTD